MGRGSGLLCAFILTISFLTLKKASWNLCHSGPSNHSHNPAENSAVGAPELRQEVLCLGLGLHGGSSSVGRSVCGAPAPWPDLPRDC